MLIPRVMGYLVGREKQYYKAGTSPFLPSVQCRSPLADRGEDLNYNSGISSIPILVIDASFQRGGVSPIHVELVPLLEGCVSGATK